MKKLLLPVLLCFGAAFFLLLLVFNWNKDDEAQGKEDVPVAVGDSVLRVAYLPTLDALPYFVALERGLFAAKGLDVELVKYLSHMDVDTALVGGSVDLAFTDIIRAERLKQREGIRLAYITSTEASWALISDRTARLNRLEQFGDKMVAMTRFSATDYLTDKTFEKVKTKAPVFKVQINDVDLRLRMLLTNEMDAEWLPEPQATEALLHKHKLVLRQGKDSVRLGVLAMRNDTLRRDSMAVQLATVYSMACDSINKNGIEAYADEMMKYCGVDTAVIRRIPKLKFAKAKKPSDEQIKIATDYLK